MSVTQAEYYNPAVKMLLSTDIMKVLRTKQGFSIYDFLDLGESYIGREEEFATHVMIKSWTNNVEAMGEEVTITEAVNVRAAVGAHGENIAELQAQNTAIIPVPLLLDLMGGADVNPDQ